MPPLRLLHFYLFPEAEGGRAGVKTVKMLFVAVMSSRPDVMQLLVFFFCFFLLLRKTQADHKGGEVRGKRDKFCYVVCLHVCISFSIWVCFVFFTSSHKHRCQAAWKINL